MCPGPPGCSKSPFDEHPKHCEGFIRHSPARTPPSNPPHTPLLKGRFGIDSTSIRRRNWVEWGSRCRISMSNRCWIDAKSTPEEGSVRRIRGWGPARGAVPNKPIPSQASLCCGLSCFVTMLSWVGGFAPNPPPPPPAPPKNSSKTKTLQMVTLQVKI